MTAQKVWKHLKQDDATVRTISEQLNIDPVITKILINRGIDDAESIKKFLNPVLSDLNDPMLMKDMHEGTEIIADAVATSKKIVICGDYDADGITSTAVIVDFLKKCGASAEYYIPDRTDEGYGLSLQVAEKLKAMAPDLVITVDCGITAVDEIKYLKESGIKVVVTDHHECGKVLPDAAVINPCRNDCAYPFKHLAGVGVVFKVIEALAAKLESRGFNISHDDVFEYLEMVTLGTIADAVPLIGENRVICKFGLEKINRTENIGLKELINVSGLSGKAINSWTVGFAIAPRINAAGRMSNAQKAVELFLSNSNEQVKKLALNLEEENKARQSTENEILEAVLKKIDEEAGFKDDKVIVVQGENWHHGVIGIVASRISERFYKPCILLSSDKGKLTGSARSISGFNIFEALCDCSEYLEKYGGHKLAAGLTINGTDIDTFRQGINRYADRCLKEEDMVPSINVDCELEPKDLTFGLAKNIELLTPFGMGNPMPLFSCKDLNTAETRMTSDEKHLRLKLKGGNTVFDAIAFNMASRYSEFTKGNPMDAVFTLEINSWNGNDKLQLNIKDVAASKREKEIPIKKTGGMHHGLEIQI